MACLLLCGCYPSPPYVNPLKAEQLEALRISEIRFEHLKDGSIDAEKAAKAAALVRARLIERLGTKFAPGKGNAVLVVALQLLFHNAAVQIIVKGKVVGANFSAEYYGANLTTAGVAKYVLRSSPEQHLKSLATPAADGLANAILCCAKAALKKQPS